MIYATATLPVNPEGLAPLSRARLWAGLVLKALWAQGNAAVLAVVTGADQQRLDAPTGMFTRHGFPTEEALVRAHVLYFSQVGQHTLDIHEDMALRLSRTRAWVRSFCGHAPTDVEV